MNNILTFGSNESILDIAARIERLYWRSTVTVKYQTMAVANAVTPLVLKSSGVDEPFHLALYRPLNDHLLDVFANGVDKVAESEIEYAMYRCRRSMPNLEQIENAMHTSGVIRIGTKHFWAQGLWAYYRQPITRAIPDREIVATLTQLLDRTAHLDLPVGKRTTLLTNTVTSWARGRRLHPARELSIPVVTPGSTYFGRIDIAVFRRGDNPPLVVEIDSQPNERSIPKLTFARDAGALPIWVRWNSGDIDDTHRGVSVIDFCDPPESLSAT